MRKKINILIIVIASVITYSCGHDHHEGHEGEHDHGHEKGGHDHHEEDENTVTLTSKQMATINLGLIEVKPQKLDVGIKVTGELELSPQDIADISPMMGGVVKSIKVIEGDRVAKGSILATMQHPDFIEIQQNYIGAINDLEFSEGDYSRQKKLFEEKIGSGKDFQKAKSKYQKEAVKVKALKIKLEMLGLNVKSITKGNIIKEVKIIAPIKGVVSLVETNIGSYVAPLTKMFEIVNNDKLHADFRVFEKDINKIKVGQKVLFKTTSIANKEFQGEIHAVSPVFEESPKALHIHADIINDKKDLIPGMFIQGEIIAENVFATAVPNKAVITKDGKQYVFVAAKSKDNKTTFHRNEVKVGFESNGMIEVKFTEGIKGKIIVADDGYYLLAEMGKAENEHTH
jgi:cobalt-zinc-cadmium efflux system membrane fusion protein